MGGYSGTCMCMHEISCTLHMKIQIKTTAYKNEKQIKEKMYIIMYSSIDCQKRETKVACVREASMLMSVWYMCMDVCVCTIHTCVCTVHMYMYVYIHMLLTINFTCDLTNSVQKWIIIEVRIVASKEMTCMHLVQCVCVRER